MVEANNTCPNCGEDCTEDRLQVCVICRKFFCDRCVVEGYGRDFCSGRCRDFFFFGEDEDDE